MHPNTYGATVQVRQTMCQVDRQCDTLHIYVGYFRMCKFKLVAYLKALRMPVNDAQVTSHRLTGDMSH